MTEISRERRVELRHLIRRDGNQHVIGRTLTSGQLRILLDYADERDEAVALLREALPQLSRGAEWNIRDRVDALLRRVEGD